MEVLEVIQLGEKQKNSANGIFLHGFAALATRLVPVIEQFLDIVPYWLIPHAPVPTGNFTGEEGYAWFPSSDDELKSALYGNFWQDFENFDSPDLQRLVNLLYKLLEDRAMLDSPLVIAGFSQGGMMASELAMFLAKKGLQNTTLLLFSSAVIASIRWETTVKNIPKTQLPRVGVFHGRQDTVLPQICGKTLYKFWNTYIPKMACIHYEFDGVHEISLDVIRTAKRFISDASSGFSS